MEDEGEDEEMGNLRAGRVLRGNRRGAYMGASSSKAENQRAGSRETHGN